jgi:tetratricopeptide (TPR) repeat protein
MKHLVLLALIALPAAPSANENPLTRAKELYEAAAYEQALATLSGVIGVTSADRVHVEQYRAFSLFALGRYDDAERAIANLVAADPTYLPSPDTASPKVLAFVAEVRTRELPALVRGLIDEGRGAYQRKDLARAREQFALALKILAEPALARRPEADDMKVVASAFLDLADAAAAPPAVATSATDGAPATRPMGESVFVPAEVIRQPIPVWEPPSRAYANDELNGAVRVTIGVDGKVTAVVIERATHPAYDVRLRQVARNWLYKPATRDGKPVQSEKVIAFRLQPTR